MMEHTNKTIALIVCFFIYSKLELEPGLKSLIQTGSGTARLPNA